MISPDDNAAGFLDYAPATMRYEQASVESDDTAMMLARRITSGSRVLDVGCGTGSITEILRNVSGATVIGIEPDEGRAQRASARGLTVINDYLSRAVIEKYGPFDFVVFADVLEHLPNPAQLVSLAKDALKPGGAVLVSVPNAAHFYTRLDLLRGVIRYEDSGISDATHLRWFTKLSLRRFFERLGFEVTFEGHTVFSGMNIYHQRKPFSWLSPRWRTSLLRTLAQWKPAIFGVQHIIEATKPKA
jgi:methionine biosynthesis protein MetW